jgi:hypothetical protein
VQSEYGKSLLRRRGELVERSFAHCYETGGMRRTHLRGHENILKRQLIHVGAFNLSLILRQLLGNATGVEKPPQQRCFAGLFASQVSDKSESVLQKPNLRIRRQVLRRIAYPTRSPALQEIPYFHPGLLARQEWK